ncbi:MAG: carbohydrate ABC transporter permease [Oscillospiraceae bacterium]|jgi:putative aldouronate transport system permease protein|nr:carbohydrate ABC transporter permease [Oscillospiraceae bacterium]
MSTLAETIKFRKSKLNMNEVKLPVKILIHILVGGFSILCIIPFLFVIIIAFTAESSISEIGYSFWPNAWSLDSITYLAKLGKQLWVSYGNSFLITIVGTILSVLMCVMYSYALFRKDFKFRGFFTMFSFFTTMFGGGLAPTYMICKNLLGLSDNYAAIIVPLLVNPFNIIVMRTFFRTSVPYELIEAASVDGSGEYRTLFEIIVPISKPGIATIALLNALAYWNEWFIPLLYIRDAAHTPLQFLLYRMQAQVDFLAKNSGIMGPEATKLAQNTPKNSLRMMMVVLVVIPIACAYPFFQRYIISGLTIGSVKE